MAELFDDLSRVLASDMPRREVFRWMAVGIAGSAFGGLFARRAEAAVLCGFREAPGLMCALQTQCCRVLGAASCCGQNRFCCPAGDSCCGVGQTCCETVFPRSRICCNAPINCCGSFNNAEFQSVCCPPKRPNCCQNAEKTIFNCCPPLCGCNNGNCMAPRFKAMLLPPNSIAVDVLSFDSSGLASITVTENVNADVDIPPIPPGSTQITVTASRVDRTVPARFTLRACSPSGCCEFGDPTLSQIQIPDGTNKAIDHFIDIPSAERFVTIQNGAPGLRRVQLVVNGKRLPARWLRDNLSRTIAIPHEMLEEQNIVSVLANGRPGSAALVLLSDSEENALQGPGASSARSIAWKPGPWQPGQNQHWGH
jgi:hypothetical protein